MRIVLHNEESRRMNLDKVACCRLVMDVKAVVGMRSNPSSRQGISAVRVSPSQNIPRRLGL